MDKFSKRRAYANVIAALKETVASGSTENTLALFQGFGALKELLLDPIDKSGWNQTDLTFDKEVQEVHQVLQERFEGRYKEAVASMRNSILTSFYTPDFIIRPMVRALASEMTEVQAILEPSAGSGNYIKPLQDFFPESTITAIEKDMATHAVLKSLHGEKVECINTGFENFRNRKFDLVVSNIPFGAVSVYDDQIFREAVPAKIKATTRIHNFFFVKALDNVREGGVVAFITSTGMMDAPTNKEVREYLVKQADLVTAIRLPNTVFESAGTYPVTDVVVLRKNSGKKGLSPVEKEFIETQKVPFEKEGEKYPLDINSYYVTHRDNVLGVFTVGGQYGRDALDLDPFEGSNDSVLEEKFGTLLEKELARGLSQRIDIVSFKKEWEDDKGYVKIPEKYPNRNILKEGNLVVLGASAGYVHTEGAELFFRPDSRLADTERISGLIHLRSTIVKLIDAELSSDRSAMDALRKELNVTYDQFTFQYGHLYHVHNKKIALLDSEGFKLLSLEKLVGDRYVKSDIFSQQVNNVERVFEKTESVQDAVLLSLNSTNKIDTGFIADLMEKPERDIIKQGLAQQVMFLDFTADGKGYRFVPKDEFLSGNIVRKLEWFEDNSRNFPDGFNQDHYTHHLALLNEIRPPYLTRELIDINMGVRWIPLEVYQDFASDLFQSKTNVTYLSHGGEYMVDVVGNSNEEEITFAAQTANGKIKGSRILEYALLDTSPRLQIKIDDGPPPVYKPDIDGMKNVEMKIRDIKNRFEEYTTKNKDVGKKLEAIYNRNVNNFVKRKYDGSHLTFEGLEYFKPKNYQPNAVWKIIQEEGGIADHTVGAGKSLTMAMATMKMRRLGIANKPLIICLKANVGAVAKEFLKAYPKAKVLAPSERDYTKQKRKAIFASIATNDWDAVIITHDNFLKIPQNPHVVAAILDEEMKALDSDIKIVKGHGTLSKRALKGLEKQKVNLTIKIKQHEASIKRDDYVMNFETMGFDHIFVDESQEFKNLGYTTRQNNVSGLGNKEGSDKARNLQYAVRTIQKRKGGDKGITFASGTPISNSLVEMYLLKKYLRPQKLEEAGIHSFDAWALMFAKKSTTYEFTVTNEIKLKERYREFINLPELGMWYGDIAHVVTAADLGQDKPRLNHCMVNIDPTKEQEIYIEKLVQFTKTKDASVLGLPPLTEGEKNAFMLLATNLAKKMSLDMRLLSSDYSYNPDGKIGHVCKIVAQEREDSTTFKGTQLIFCDMGTPSGNNFNVYAEIKRVLILHHNVPENEIAFIHSYETKAQKEKLFKAVNDGDIRVLVGSTKKLGTGVNVQTRLVAIHHVDLPWRPSDLDQQDGRGARQGAVMCKLHRNNEMKSYVYAVNRTLDAYQFNILSNKQKFINQIKTTVNDRKFDEGSMDQEGGMNFAEYVALLSGNTDLLEKVKLEKKYQDLSRTYQAFLGQRNQAEAEIVNLLRINKNQSDSLTKLYRDLGQLERQDIENIPITIEGKNIEDRKQVGEYLLNKVKELDKLPSELVVSVPVASIEGFTLKYERNFMSIQLSKLIVESKEGIRYNYSDGKLNENPALAGRFLLDAIKRIPKVIEGTNERIKENLLKIETYQKVTKEEFKDVNELKKIETSIQEMTDKIERKAAEIEKKEPNKQTITIAI